MGAVDIVAKRIFQARKNAHLSQQDLALAIGVSDKSVSAYEKGRAAPPLSKLKKIASKTGQSLNYFTEEKASKEAIASKLIRVEQELREIKKLLKRTSQD